MKVRKRKWLIPLLLVTVLAVCYFSNPFLRVKTFIYVYHEKIEAPLRSHNSVPVIPGVDMNNTWEGEYTMTEFILFRRGFGSETKYYGCYYSWDDGPLAFQNVDVQLIQNGHQYWKWKSDGDNRGATQRILPHWYYFEASF